MARFRIAFHLVLIFMLGCGELNDNQANRQKIKDGIKDHQLKRVTKDQIINAAYDQGSNLVIQLEQQSTDIGYWQTSDGQSVLDSMNLSKGHNGFKLIPANEPPDRLSAEEIALMEAYQYSSENGQPDHENVQSIKSGLLFTSPISNEGEFLGMWSLHLSKKTLIRNL